MIFRQTVEISAPPEAIFDLISRVEDLSQYSKLIDSINKTGEKTYHWKAKLGGIPIEWDAVISEEYRPWRFSWHSIKGFQNSGGYTLTPVNSGTKVSFEIEYNLKASILEKALAKLSDSYFKKLSEDILSEIKKKLEENKS